MAKRNNGKPAIKEPTPNGSPPRQVGIAPTMRTEMPRPVTPRPEMPRPETPKPEASRMSTLTAVAMALKAGPVPTQAEITERAKAVWEASGRKPGRDEQNWLEAERQLRKERGLK
jgi:hypothetical protein